MVLGFLAQRITTIEDQKAKVEAKNLSLQAEVARLGEKLAATSAAGGSAPEESAVEVTAMCAVSKVCASKVTPVGGSVRPVASPDKASPAHPPAAGTNSVARQFSPAPTVTKGKATPSLPAATVAKGTAVPSGAGTTPSRGKQTPVKVRKQPAMDDENPDKCPYFDMYSPLVEKELNAVYGTPRRYTRRPLRAVNTNSGGNRAAGGRTPSLAERKVTKPVDMRSPITDGVPPLAARVVTVTVEKRNSPATRPGVAAPAVVRTPIAEEVPQLAAGIVTGAVGQCTSAGKGPAIKIVRGGAPASRVAKAHESGKSGGKVRAAPSGRVLRSATTAAAAGAKRRNEAGMSGVSRAVPVGAVSPAPPARSTRSSTRR